MRRSDLALAGIACAAVPGMKPVSVQEVSRGPEDEATQHQTAIIEDSTGRTWVVRVPLTTVAGAELERNEALVGQLGKHLPFKVPAATGFAVLGPEQGRAAVYPYVDGSALNLHHLPPGPGLASAVGRAIAAVHNIAGDVFEDYAVPVFDAASHRARCVSEVDRAASTGLVPTGLLARWEEALEAPGLWRFAPTPVHGSLDGWAFLVAFTDDDAATGRVVALTQWDHAMVGDPAQDFAILTDQLTPAALDSVLESYSLARSSRPDPHLVYRARLAAEMRLIKGLAHAAAAGADDTVQSRVDELRKLDRLTASDHSLVPATALPGAGEGVDLAGLSGGSTAGVQDQQEASEDGDDVPEDFTPDEPTAPVSSGHHGQDLTHAGAEDADASDAELTGDDGMPPGFEEQDFVVPGFEDPDVTETDFGETGLGETGLGETDDPVETPTPDSLGSELDEGARMRDLYDLDEDPDEEQRASSSS